MSLGSRIWLTALIAALTACGAGPIAGDGGETDATGGDDEVGTTDGDSGESDGTSESTSESTSDDGTGDESESDGTTTGEVPTACFGEVGFALIDAVNSTVLIQEAGAESFEVDASGPLDGNTSIAIAASANYLAIATTQSLFENGALQYAGVLRLFERGDDVPTYVLEDEAGFQRLFVDDDGGVTLVAQSGSGYYVALDGATESLGSFQPGGPLTNGWIPGRHMGFNEPTDSGFLELGNGDFVPVGVGGNNWWRFADGAIEQLDGNTGVFYRGTTEGTQTVELPAANIWSLEAEAGDYRLFASNDGEDTKLSIRLDVESGELLTVDPVLPVGLEAFDCYYRTNRIDADGRITFELRDDDSARVMLWDPASDAWTQLGQLVSNVDDLEPYAVADHSFAITGIGLNQSFCPHPDWGTPPPGALLDHSTQFVRVDPPFELVLDQVEGWNLTVDPHERCLSWTTIDATAMTEIDSGETIELPHTGWVTWLP